MAQEDTSFRDLVARLNAMSNLTPEEERMQMMESVGKAPKVLDDKEVTLADIAKLAGIKEYVAPVKHSKKAEKPDLLIGPLVGRDTFHLRIYSSCI